MLASLLLSHPPNMNPVSYKRGDAVFALYTEVDQEDGCEYDDFHEATVLSKDLCASCVRGEEYETKGVCKVSS